VLGLGKIYDARHDLVVIPDPESDVIISATTWSGDAVGPERLAELYTGYPALPPTNMEWFISLGDLWWLPLAAALHHGVSREDGQQAFLETREFMSSGDYRLEPVPGLARCLARLRERGVRQILATNSPEESSLIILRQLGLERAFDELLFECNKPDSSRRLFGSLIQQYAPIPRALLSIGDNYTNEIVPAHELGARTLFIDSYQYLKRGRWDVRVRTLREALTVLDRIKPPRQQRHES